MTVGLHLGRMEQGAEIGACGRYCCKLALWFRLCLGLQDQWLAACNTLLLRVVGVSAQALSLRDERANDCSFHAALDRPSHRGYFLLPALSRPRTRSHLRL